jgi:hypothetical protein
VAYRVWFAPLSLSVLPLSLHLLIIPTPPPLSVLESIVASSCHPPSYLPM